eukprot:9164934-Alexandrium_andersonii.AAC.1
MFSCSLGSHSGRGRLSRRGTWGPRQHGPPQQPHQDSYLIKILPDKPQPASTMRPEVPTTSSSSL